MSMHCDGTPGSKVDAVRRRPRRREPSVLRRGPRPAGAGPVADRAGTERAATPAAVVAAAV